MDFGMDLETDLDLDWGRMLGGISDLEWVRT